MAPKTPKAPETNGIGGDMQYCLVKMTEGQCRTSIEAAYVKDMATGKPKTELDFTGAKATSTTVTGSGGQPDRDFVIDVKGGTCTVGGDKMNLYRQDGPSRDPLPPSISEPIFPAPGPRR